MACIRQNDITGRAAVDQYDIAYGNPDWISSYVLEDHRHHDDTRTVRHCLFARSCHAIKLKLIRRGILAVVVK